MDYFTKAFCATLGVITALGVAGAIMLKIIGALLRSAGL
jgi:hypothetical protein